MRRIIDIIAHNFGFKALALLLAIILWLVIINIVNPEKTKVYTVPVSITNGKYLERNGQTYQVLNDTDEITFSATGRRSVIEAMGDDDFEAVANLENITSDNKVLIHVIAKRYSHSVDLEDRDQYLELDVEDLKTVTLPVKVVTDGELADDCYVKDTEVTPSSIHVTGAKSLVAKLKQAQVTIDTSDADGDVQSKAKIRLLNQDGDVVSQDKLTLNKSKAKATVSVWMNKSVALNIKTSGTPKSGYQLKGISLSTDNITLTGKASVIKKKSKLTIQTTKLSLSGKHKSFTTKLDLNNYLPDDVFLAKGESSTLVVKAVLEKEANS